MGESCCRFLRFALPAFLAGAGLCRAQVANPGWSEPVRISTPGWETERANIVADRGGRFHVVWVEREREHEGGVLRYASFDGEVWSPAVTVRAAATGFHIGQHCLTIDGGDNLHLTWTESDRRTMWDIFLLMAPVLYTRVAAADARDPARWRAPLTIKVKATCNRIRVDSNGALHLLYSAEERPDQGLFHTRSDDGGDTWTPPVRIDSDASDLRTPLVCQVEADKAGVLHAAWDNRAGGLVVEIAYAKSTDGGRNWTRPVTLDQPSVNPNEIQYGWPMLAVQGSNVHVLWTGGKQDGNGRRYRYSSDAGETWKPLEQLFGELVSFVAADALVPDAADGVHYMDQLRYPMGVYAGHWQAGKWSDPSLVYLIQRTWDEPFNGRYHAHRVNMAASSSQLLTTFTAGDPPPRFIVAMHTLLAGFTSVSAASFAGGGKVAPESAASGFGSGLASAAVGAGGSPLPTRLGETEVEVVDAAGVVRLAPLFFVSPGQINYMLPAGTAEGQARVRVRNGRGLVAAGRVEVVPVAPSLYSANARGAGVAAANYMRVSGESRTTGLLFDPGTLAAVPIDVRAGTGDVYLLLYGTGFRAFRSAVTATVGKQPVPVLAAVPQGEYPGLDQINIGPLPTSLAGSGEVEVRLTADGQAANPVTVLIR